MHIANFSSSITTKSKEYKKCVKGQNPLYLRSMPSPNVTPLEFINFFKNLYEKNIKLIDSPKKKKVIPKIIHQIWLGRKIPQEYKEFQDSWKSKHPEWEYILWNQDSLKKAFPAGFYNQNMFEQARHDGNFAKMADVARYEILHEFGGLYVDCDCKCIKPFDILHQTFDFYAGLEHIANGLLVGNALIGSQPKHPILQKCLQNIKEYENKKIDMKYWKGKTGYSSEMEEHYATTLVTTGPILLTKSIWQIVYEPKTTLLRQGYEGFYFWRSRTKNIDIIFPPTYFFPFAEGHINSVKPETFSCHYFKGVWKEELKVKYNKG